MFEWKASSSGGIRSACLQSHGVSRSRLSPGFGGQHFRKDSMLTRTGRSLLQIVVLTGFNLASREIHVPDETIHSAITSVSA